MANVYTSDFNAATVGSIAPNWANKIGTFAVASAGGVSGSRSFGSTSQSAGDVALLTGISALADMEIKYAQVVPAADGFGDRPLVSPIVRANSGYTAGYMLLLGNDSSAQVYRRNGSGHVALVGTASLGFTIATGDVLYIKLRIVGSTITGYAWRNSDAEATTPFITKTDSNVTAAGYAGIYHSPSYSAAYADNVYVDDTAVAVGATVTPPSPANGDVGVASGNFTVTLGATSASATTCTLSDGGAGGTFTPASLVISAGNTVGTFTYTPASAGAKTISVSINNGYSLTGSPMTYTGNAANATSVALSGASSSGAVNSPVTLTLTLDGPAASSTNVTFADTLGATFSPNPVTIAGGSTGGTTTFTPTATGSHSVSITNSAGLAQTGTPFAYAASNTGVFPVDTAGIYWSPYNWDTLNVGDYGVATKSMQTTCCGAYLKFLLSGSATLSLGIDVSMFSGFTAADMPLLYYCIDDGAMQSVQLPTSGTTLSLATGLSTSGSRSVQIWLMGMRQLLGTRWNASGSPSNCLRINSVIAAPGSTITAPALQSKRVIFYGDSIIEGVLSLGSNATEPLEHRRSAAWLVGQSMKAEYGVVGYGMQGWASVGAGSVPAFPSSWNFHNGGRARSFASAPDYAFTMFGYNGTTLATTVTNWITAARAAFGAATWIFVVIAPSGIGATATSDGVANYKTANPGDTKVALIDNRSVIPVGPYLGITAPNWLSIDGVHPNELGNAQIAAAIVSNAREAMVAMSSATFPTASQVLTGISYGPNGADYTGTISLPTASQVLSGVTFGAGGATTGNVTLPAVTNVRSGTSYGASGTASTGTLTLPAANVVLSGNNYGAGGTEYSGTATSPAVTNVRSGVTYGVGGTGSAGNLTLPTAAQVQTGVQFGANGTQYTGTYAGSGGGSAVFPAAAQVLTGVAFGPNGSDYTGTVVLPSAAQVLAGIGFGASGALSGTITLPTASQVLSGVSFGPGSATAGNVVLPSASNVRSGVQYGVSGTGSTGNVTLPAAGDVRSGTQYGSAGTQYTGTLSTTGGGGTYPAASQVIIGVSYGPSGADYTGNVTLPSASQVQAGVGYGAAGTQYVGLLTTGGVVAAGQVPSGRYLRVGA